MDSRKALLLFAAIPAVVLFFCGCHVRTQREILENEKFRVELLPGLPLIRSYSLISSGDTLTGDGGSTGWVVNGHRFPWTAWSIREDAMTDRQNKTTGRVYHMQLSALDLGFDYSLSLLPDGILISVDHIRDPRGRLETLDWGEQPLLQTGDSSIRWWTRQTGLSSPFERKKIPIRGLWNWNEFRGRAGDSVSGDAGVDACLWKSGMVAGLISNTDIFPVRLGGGRRFSIGLNTYYYRISGQVRPDFQAKLLLAGDLNGDGQTDDHDYFYWRNRQLPDVPDTLRKSIAYKVFMDRPDQSGPSTNMSQLDEIVTAIHNITDGIPQIVYMVGWQFKGHDTGYPALDKWNDRLGPHQTVFDKAIRFRDSLNTILSYHLNIDDAFRFNKDWDSHLMATDYDGGPMFWQMSYRKTDSNFHISHYKDVKSGAVFKRLDAFMQTVPVRQVIHLDAMRSINCNPAWEKDSIGVLQELDLGLRPVMRWLKQRGIEVTTEGQNGNPHELEGWIAGVYHMDDPSEATQIVYHRKLLGGGLGEGRGRYECGMGTSLHEDIAYRKIGDNLSFVKDWNKIMERIYLGSMLYLYYQQRQITDVRMTSDRVRISYGDSTQVDIDKKQDHLLVHRGNLIIARDDDRFIPLGNRIYAFSKNGSRQDWVLPDDFAGKPLEIYSLTTKGPVSAGVPKVTGNRIQLSLTADEPIEIKIKR